jgi:4a-hydroxytetrahydrobiopterin dehydratase
MHGNTRTVIAESIDMEKLESKQCTPCRSGAPPLARGEIYILSQEIHGWSIVGDHHIEKEYAFRDFKSALAFVNIIGDIAEREGHHPDLGLSWGRVKVRLFTHKIDGLHENDFIMAARIDEAFRNFSQSTST